jgi:quercetin dioxygenase-like cupin family protein
MLKKIGIGLAFITATLMPMLVFAETPTGGIDKEFPSVITQKFFEKAKNNVNWKVAFATGKDAQVVFMNITPVTNPSNEIGMETHKFDQVIFVIEGQAESILSGRKSTVKAGDMIFIPQGVSHNFINLSGNKPFKIISVYSGTDIPVNSIYKTKSDAPKD